MKLALVSQRTDLFIISLSPRTLVSDILGSSTRSSLHSSLTTLCSLLKRSLNIILSFVVKFRTLTDTRAPAEGLVHWTSTRVSLSSRPAFPPPTDHQASPPHEHLTHTSSPSSITVPQSVLDPAFAAESLLSPLILYLNPTPSPTPNLSHHDLLLRFTSSTIHLDPSSDRLYQHQQVFIRNPWCT